MFLLLLALVLIGVLVGVLFGLVPGLHPNTLVLFIPVFAALGSFESIVLVVSIAVSNTLLDIIPSVFIAAPDEGNELSVLPTHRMLLRGGGYDAVKIYVSAGYFSLLLCIVLLPVLIVFIPFFYNIIVPYVWILLVLIIAYMVLTEKRKIVALIVLLMCSTVGVLLGKIPENNIMLLFPVFSGLFGASILLLQARNKSSYPRQNSSSCHIEKRQLFSSVFGGSSAGIAAGFLPGVGSSQMATFATLQKSDESFVATMGSIAASNILLSIISLWLIEKSRSGAAIILENSVSVLGPTEVMLMVITTLIAASMSVIIALFFAKKFSSIVQKFNFSSIGKLVIGAIVVIIFLTTGFVGIFLFLVCLSIGIYVNLSGVKRGIMMSVLLLPTILFFLHF